MLTRLLAEVKKLLASREPVPRTLLLPPASLDARGVPFERLLKQVAAVLEAQGSATETECTKSFKSSFLETKTESTVGSTTL